MHEIDKSGSIDPGQFAPKTAVAKAVGHVEAFVGAAAAGVLGVSTIFLCVIVSLVPDQQFIGRHLVAGVNAVIPATVLVALLEIVSMIFVLRCLQNHRPPALLRMALRQFQIPILLRPLVAIWWFGHFVAMALGGHETLHWFSNFDHLTVAQDVAIWVVQLVILIAVNFSSNGFLLLAAATFSKGPALIWVHRWRLLMDLSLALAMAILPPIHWKF